MTNPNTMKLLMLLVESGNVTEDIANDQGGTYSKLGHLSQMTDEIMAMSDFDAAAFRQEVADGYDSAEMAEFVEAFKTKFDLEDDVLEARIEHGLALVVKGLDYAEELRAFYKSLTVDPDPQPEVA